MVLHQFQRFVRENAKAKSNADSSNGQETDINDQYKKFMEEKYPGMKSSPNQMVAMMTSPDPGQALSVQTNVNPLDRSNDPCAEDSNSRKKRESETTEDQTGWHWERASHYVCFCLSVFCLGTPMQN